MKNDSEKLKNVKTINKISKSKINNINKIYYLIEECKKMAYFVCRSRRCGFVAID